MTVIANILTRSKGHPVDDVDLLFAVLVMDIRRVAHELGVEPRGTLTVKPIRTAVTFDDTDWADDGVGWQLVLAAPPP